MLILTRRSFHWLTWGIATGLIGIMVLEGWLQQRAGGETLLNTLNGARAASGMIAVWVIVMHLNAQRRMQDKSKGPLDTQLALSERHFHIMTWCLALGTLSLPLIDSAGQADYLALGTAIVDAAFICLGIVIMWGMVLVLDSAKGLQRGQ